MKLFVVQNLLKVFFKCSSTGSKTSGESLIFVKFDDDSFLSCSHTVKFSFATMTPVWCYHFRAQNGCLTFCFGCVSFRLMEHENDPDIDEPYVPPAGNLLGGDTDQTTAGDSGEGRCMFLFF